MSSYLLFACTDFAQGILTLKLVIKVFKHYLNKRPRMALLSLYSLMSFVCKRIIFVVKSWGYFAITIHTKSIKFPQTNQNKLKQIMLLSLTSPTILRCLDRKRSLHPNALVTGGIRDNTILNEFLQDGQYFHLRPGV